MTCSMGIVYACFNFNDVDSTPLSTLWLLSQPCSLGNPKHLCILCIFLYFYRLMSISDKSDIIHELLRYFLDPQICSAVISLSILVWWQWLSKFLAHNSSLGFISLWILLWFDLICLLLKLISVEIPFPYLICSPLLSFLKSLLFHLEFPKQTDIDESLLFGLEI